MCNMTLLQRLLTKTRSVETIESERRSQNSKVENKDKQKEKNEDVEKSTGEISQQEDSTKQI